MRNLPQLRRERAIQLPLAMAMEIDPERGDPIQVTAAVGVFQIDATAPFNDEGPLVLPLTLLGEGMPEVAVILRLKPRGAGRGSHEDGPL